MLKAQMQAQQVQDSSSWHMKPMVKRELYANHIEIERREHDAEIHFALESGSEGATVVRITVPLGALEGLT